MESKGGPINDQEGNNEVKAVQGGIPCVHGLFVRRFLIHLTSFGFENMHLDCLFGRENTSHFFFGFENMHLDCQAFF